MSIEKPGSLSDFSASYEGETEDILKSYDDHLAGYRLSVAQKLGVSAVDLHEMSLDVIGERLEQTNEAA
ncbi:hypothetical protein H0X10_01430 [Candidatus Saccharibacteria bacterium]|nr:hypothetical protein [Candidatus Saccharibacteria bacterium]